MSYTYRKLPLALVATLITFGCAAEEYDTMDSPVLVESSELTEPTNVTEPSSAEREFSPFADVSVATSDGADMYRYRFATIEGGPTAILVESPLGYPEPDIPSECALDTFLRVADADAEVPREFLEECGVPQEGEPSRPVRADEPTYRVRELANSKHAAGMDYVMQPSKCEKPAFDARLDVLEDLASYQPLINTNCSLECELFVAWNNSGCAFYNGDGVFQNNCSALDYQALVLQYGPFGQVCLEYGGWECDQIPNPECAHTEWVIGDWGPYGTWSRFSSHTSRTTRVRAEVTTCGPTATQGGWYVKQNGGDPWGTKYNVTFNAYSTATLVLSAGWDGSNDWRGWDFKIEAQGNNFHVATAWVELQGKNRFTCPLQI